MAVEQLNNQSSPGGFPEKITNEEAAQVDLSSTEAKLTKEFKDEPKEEGKAKKNEVEQTGSLERSSETNSSEMDFSKIDFSPKVKERDRENKKIVFEKGADTRQKKVDILKFVLMMIKKDAGQKDSIHDPRLNDDKINEPTISFKNEEGKEGVIFVNTQNINPIDSYYFGVSNISIAKRENINKTSKDELLSYGNNQIAWRKVKRA